MLHNMKHRAIIAVISAFFLLFGSHIHAQGISTDGKDFYVGFVNPSFNRVVIPSTAHFFRVYLIVSSYQDNTVSISYFTDDGTEDTVMKYTVQKRKSIQIPLDLTRIRMTDPGDMIKEYRSVHVTAESPISVQFFSSGADGCGMYTSIPTTLLGRKYVAASYNDNPEGTLAMPGGSGTSVIDVACGFFEIIGTKNGTTVTITPTTTTQGGKHVGVNKGAGSNGTAMPYTISLNRGQCYMVKSGCTDNQFDFTGSIIESDKPVAVISGHENAGLGSVGGRPLEGRDYMVEQMIPVNHWDNKDYVSIPFVDSDPYNGDHTGDFYRAIVYDTSTVNVSMSVAGKSGTTIFPLSRYKTGQAPEIEAPISFTSNTKPFMAYQIDQTNQSAKQPYPRPSMSELIPISRWKNSYLWFVPSNVDERLQAYFINIIAPKAKFDSIYVSKGGQKDVLIGQAGLSVVKVYQNIPDHPELMGKTYKVVPGSYYARANFPFIIYHYGNRAIDPDGDLGDFDYEDYFFSYASSLGYQYTSPDTGNISITVDTLCNSWKVCVTDNMVGGSVSSITLLDDPYGDFIIPPSGHAPYQYFNVTFDPKDDPSGTHEIIFSGDNKSECVTINIQNPGKDGYAPLLLATRDGQTKVIELSLSKSLIAISPDPETGGNLGLIKVGTAHDTMGRFINLPSSQRNYLVTSVSLSGSDTAMKILSVTPALPALIKPGDTLKYAVRFSAHDTSKHFDTLLIATDCSMIRIPLMGEGGCGIIVTSDLDFGYIIIGSSVCIDTLRIKNIGKLPLTLTPDFLLQDTANFSIDPVGVISSSNRFYTLPYVIAPGDYVRVRICYDPKDEIADSTAVIWKTDIPSPYTLSLKTFSVLRGNGSGPHIVWDPDTLTYVADTTKKIIKRAFLRNASPLPTVIDNIMIRGKDSAEFSIDKMQYIPPINIDSSVSFWVDIAFTPDMTKPDSIRFVDRHAQAIATNTFDVNKPAILELIGTFKTLSVSGDLPLEALTLSPNPSSGGDVTLSFGLEKSSKLSFAVYDVLGKEVVSLPISYFETGKQNVMIPTSKLREGSYILRITDGVLMKSLSFRIVK
jgi:hypothetical protein